MKVKAPKGYHWMKSGKGAPKLMKNPPGGYKAHKGASQTFNYAIQKLHKKKKCLAHIYTAKNR